jgi:omega-6 fatty acid desaturase (delta-12 desaturase)
MTVAPGTGAGVTTVQQTPFVIPDVAIKDLLSAIPSHCTKRSAFRSSLYIVWDCALIAGFYTATTYLDPLITPEHLSLPHPALYTLASFSLWSLYTFATGLVATGLWVVAHECGHQAFSESKAINNSVGWVLHSALGVPYHSWRITHAKHHASTGHMQLDQVWVPKTRSQAGLSALDPSKEDINGASIADDVKQEFWEALGDSPIGACIGVATYFLIGWQMYIATNASGQRYPAGTNHFVPKAPLFSPNQYGQVIVSDIGIVLWLAGVIAAIYHFGFFEVFRTYLVPYLWVNHWLVLITFLQHTDPLLPHYRAPEFTFSRGALATLDRTLLGDLGSIAGWIGATATHGISETHVLHHVSSKIPHYHAWEATDALRKLLADRGLKLEGRPGGWAEAYRVYRACKFVEDQGNVLFYKNAYGLATTRGVFPETGTASDSGIEIDTK